MTGGRVYRECSPVVDSRFDTDVEGSLTNELVETLAEAKQVPPSDITPLYDIIDLEAVTRLFNSVETPTLLTVRFENWVVFIRTDGRLRVCDTTQPSDPVPVFDGTPD